MSEDKNKAKEASEAALKARLAQLELENRVRLQNQPSAQGAPITDTPRRGFGSAQGIAHLRHTEYQRRGPNPPVPPPAIPEPGKARFGGTYLRTPLPGILPPDGGELIPPVPAVPVGTPPSTSVAACVDTSVAPAKEPVEPSKEPAAKTFADASQAAARAVTAAELKTTQKDVAQAKPPTPPSSLTAPARSVIGGSAIAKAPLPALYHAGMKAAADAEQAKAHPLPSARPAAEAKPPADSVIAIPENAEVTKDGPKPPPRAKRFKNPTLAPKEP